MNSEGDHLLQQADGWLDMMNAVLHAPRAVAFAFNLRFRADGEILMPRDGPVFRRGFVEKDGADGLETGVGQEAEDFRGSGEITEDSGAFAEAAHASGTCFRRDTIRFAAQGMDFLLRENARVNLKTALNQGIHVHYALPCALRLIQPVPPATPG